MPSSLHQDHLLALQLHLLGHPPWQLQSCKKKEGEERKGEERREEGTGRKGMQTVNDDTLLSLRHLAFFVISEAADEM